MSVDGALRTADSHGYRVYHRSGAVAIQTAPDRAPKEAWFVGEGPTIPEAGRPAANQLIHHLRQRAEALSQLADSIERQLREEPRS